MLVTVGNVSPRSSRTWIVPTRLAQENDTWFVPVVTVAPLGAIMFTDTDPVVEEL